ncbi:hypothetical protein GCM10011529_08180 [Polymorphobacter glacialis]|uniref:Uncharacterized protein n=1 Tax=Sandarakinorhabdus glacialis TaxID=1614636 RepID=A0A916ZMY9_9SPHN|nr:hypothetical protein [Polymorphobacter glacialis]GGE04178.1 hypothetical protein GCM10011529_08180 [Polymorphobacter glacialis]
MKVILQDYEPQVRAIGEAVVKPVVRKSRLRFNPVKSELRLFHAL